MAERRSSAPSATLNVRGGAEPRLPAPEPGTPPDRDHFLNALRVEHRRAWVEGSRLPTEAVLRDRPELAGDDDAILELLHAEWLARAELSEALDPAELHARFPALADRLEQRLRVQNALRRAETWNWPQTQFAQFPLPPAPPPAPALHIAGYEVLEEIGRGGMGVVYKARQTELGRVVALKMILGARFASAEQLLRFRLEGETAARVQHPNIVQVHEVGTFDGQPFLVLEHVEGGTLARRLREGGAMPPRDAATLIEVLARGVHFAHAHGVVHRDLKPSNILLAADGTPKITDFGLAKHLDREGMTETGRVMGTPEYMAPEQAAGRAHDIGPLVDVYALGAILYECLTGRPPFEASESRDVMLQVLARDPASPRQLNARCPRDLETVALKCLQKEPAGRYPSAEALANDLRLFLDDEPILARPVGAAERAWKWARRRPVTAGPVVGLVLVTTLGFAGVTAALVYALEGWREAAREHARADEELARAERERAEADRQRGEAETQRSKAVAEGRAARHQEEAARQQRRLAETHLGFSRLTHALHEWRQNNLATSRQLLGHVPEEGRGWVWRYLKGLHHGELLGLAHPSQVVVHGVAFSPDGRHVAAGGNNPYGRDPLGARFSGTVAIWDLTTGKLVRALRERQYQINQIAYSPDGRFLASAGQGPSLVVWNAITGRPLAQVQEPRGQWFDVAWSPDGQHLAAASDLGHALMVEAATGRIVRRLHERDGEVRRVAYSPDGRHLAVSGSQLGVWSVATGEAVKRFKHGAKAGLRFSADGARLATVEGNRVRVYTTADWAEVSSFSGHEGRVNGLAFSPDGRAVATAGADCTVRVWDVESATEISTWRGHEGRAQCVAFHPHGHLLVSGAAQPGDVKVWDLTRTQEYLRVGDEKGHDWINALAFDATGRQVVLLRRAGRLETRELTGLPGEGRSLTTSREWRVPGALAAFNRGATRLVAVTVEDGHRAAAWDIAGGKRLPGGHQHTLPVWHVASDGSGRLVASAAFGQDRSKRRLPDLACEVAVWEADTGRVRLRLDTTFERTTALALSLDGRFLARGVMRYGAAVDPRKRVTFRSLDSVVELWAIPAAGAAAPREPLLSLGVGRQAVYSVAFSEKGDVLACGTAAGDVSLWEVPAGRALHVRPMAGPQGLDGLAFSPDGKLLAGATRTRVTVWDVGEGLEVLTLRGAPPRYQDSGFSPRVAWSPDGRYLAASHWQHNVSVWDGADLSAGSVRAKLRRAAGDRLTRWHLREAGESARRRQATAAQFHLSQVERLGDTSHRAGAVHGQLGQWKKAAEAYARGLPAGAAAIEHRRHALLLLDGGDAEGHRAACARMRRQLGHDPHQASGADLALAHALAPRPAGDAALASTAVALARQDPGCAWHQFVAALASLRAGRADEAILFARRCEAMSLDWKDRGALTQLTVALAYHAKGNAAAGRAALQLARARMRAELARVGDGLPPWLAWEDWLLVRVLVREASAALALGSERTSR